METTAYRIVQEALTNVARHAGVGTATVRVWSAAESVGLQIEDRGCGFHPESVLAAMRSHGLAGMQERVILLEGHLAIESRPEEGCRLTAELPLRIDPGGRAMSISIVLADDHPVVRRGMQALLEAEPDLVVVGESGDGLETTHLVERLKPDVLILDLVMPGLSGLEVLRAVRQRSPGTRVVVLSMHSNNAFVAEALKNGANAYVLKGGEEENLVRAVRRPPRAGAA